MQVRLGPYWWKRFSEKKINDKEVWRWNRSGIIFLGITLVLALAGFYFLHANGIEKVNHDPRAFLQVVPLFFIVVIAAVISLACLTITGVALSKAIIASFRFRTIFGFSPPVTDEGHKAVQLAVDRVLSFLAIARAEKYLREKVVIKIIKEIQDDLRSKADCDLRALGEAIVMHETRLNELEKLKKAAEKNYYKTRDAAQEEFLPKPFVVRKSFKNYLPKEMLQKLSQEEKQ